MRNLKSLIKITVRCMLALIPISISYKFIRFIPQLRYYLPNGRILLMDTFLDDVSVQIDTTYPIEREMLTGVYDVETMHVIKKFVKAGDYCMDIGANVGALTLFLAKTVGSTGKVYAFEPGPPTFERLKLNLGLNPALAQVIFPINVGVSDTPGFLMWDEDIHNRGNAGLLGKKGTRVEVDTIDSIVATHMIHQVNFVKIDIEGMELEALRGGVRTWMQLKPVIYFESLEAFRSVRKFDIYGEIETLFAEIGYKLYNYDERNGIKPTSSSFLSNNTLAIHDDRLSQFCV